MVSEEIMMRKLQEVGWPSPVTIKCVKFDLNAIVSIIEHSHKVKAFYAELVRWLIESEGKPTFRKVTGIEIDDDIRKAMFGEISSKEAIKNLIDYFAKSAPGQLINFSKTILEEEIANYVKYYVTKNKPPETILCDKLKDNGIYTIALIEDTQEYGPVCKFIINPQGLLQKLVEEPAGTAEFATVSKITEWIISNTSETILFGVDNELEPKKVLLASTSFENKERVLDILNSLMNKIKDRISFDKFYLINVLLGLL